MSYRLSVLGTVGLWNEEGRPVQSVLQQPRRFALLVYLALESRSGPVGRDTVLGVFWPEKSSDQARSSLNQAVYYLRRSLGGAAIQAEGNSLSVNSAVLTCDAVELLRAHEEGRWRDAAALYGGELLPGFFDGPGTVQFEHWLDRARNGVQRAAASSAWKLAEEESRDGKPMEAVLWARKAWEWWQGGEAEARRLMEFLAGIGDRKGVVEVYEGIRSALAAEGAQPAPATQSLFDRLRVQWEEEDRGGGICRSGAPQHAPRGGKRDMGGPGDGPGVSSPETRDGSTTPGESPVPSRGAPGPQHGESRPGPRDELVGAVAPALRGRHESGGWRAGLASLLATLALMFAFLSVWAPTRERAPGVPTGRTAFVVAMPQAMGEDALLARAFQARLAGTLGEAGFVAVVADASGEPSAPPGTLVVRSTLLRGTHGLQAHVLLSEGGSGTTLANTRLDVPSVDSLDAVEVLARGAAQFARRESGRVAEERRLLNSSAPAEAVRLVQLARRDMEVGASLREQGLTDPALVVYGKADSVLAEAAALSDWGLPWLYRAEIAYRNLWAELLGGERGSEAKMAAVRRGLELVEEAAARGAPEAEVRELRALFREWEWLLAQPDPTDRSFRLLAQVEADARRAVALDPGRARAWNVLGSVLLHRGEWAEAYWALQRAVKADLSLENAPEILLRLFTAAWELQNLPEAEKWCGILRERMQGDWPAPTCELMLLADFPHRVGEIASIRARAEQWRFWPRVAPQVQALEAVVWARAGHPPRARKLLEELEAPTRGEDPELSVLLAWAFAELGETHRARGELVSYLEASPSGHGWVKKSRQFTRLDLRNETDGAGVGK